MDTPPNIDLSRLPSVHDGQYPPNAKTPAERLRFRLCLGIAQRLMGEEMSATVWQMSRRLYNGDIPT